MLLTPDQIKVSEKNGVPEMQVYLWSGQCMCFPDDSTPELASSLQNYVDIVDVNGELGEVLRALDVITGCEFESEDGDRDEGSEGFRGR